MAGTMRPNEMNMSTTPTTSTNQLPSLNVQTDVTKKPSTPRAPRIDVEPLYAAVKGSISDPDWTTYKQSLSSFLLGNLNQEELSRTLSKILTTPALEHAHNALFTAIYANIWRDSPEAGIASWVSSSDKPTSGTVKGTHDEGEKRLKHEIMQLSRRERKRLKTIPASEGGAPESSWGPSGVGPTEQYFDARKAKQPELGPGGGNQGGGFGKTNWDLEIRKRYTAPLFSETHEFPTTPSILARLTPTCYEHGLPQGHSAPCPEFLNLAVETYIKEALTSLLGKVSANGPGYVRTGSFKKKVRKEEREMVRLGTGELPVEAEERRKRKLLCTEDLRLALSLGDGYFGQYPVLAGGVWHARYLDSEGVEDLYNFPAQPLTNGQVWNVQLEFDNGDADGDAMMIDSEVMWQGGSVKDVEELDRALDDVLALADL